MTARRVALAATVGVLAVGGGLTVGFATAPGPEPVAESTTALPSALELPRLGRVAALPKSAVVADEVASSGMVDAPSGTVGAPAATGGSTVAPTPQPAPAPSPAPAPAPNSGGGGGGGGGEVSEGL